MLAEGAILMNRSSSDPSDSLQPPDASLALQLLPWTDWDSVNPIIDEVLARIAAEPGIQHQVGPFETVLEGELTHLMSFSAELIRVASDQAGVDVFAIAKIMYKPSGKGCGLS